MQIKKISSCLCHHLHNLKNRKDITMEKDYPNFSWKISIVGNVIMNIIVRMNIDFETWFVSFVCQMVFNICSNSLLINKQTANKKTNSAIIKLNYRKHITSGEKKLTIIQGETGL